MACTTKGWTTLREFGSFDVEEYRKRLRLLRRLYGETQRAFAQRLGIPFKRWNHYERGYPIPRETAFILREKIQDISTDWIWFGNEGNLSIDMLRRLKQAEREEAAVLVARPAPLPVRKKVRKTVVKKKVDARKRG